MNNYQNSLNARFDFNGPVAELVGADSFVLQVTAHNLPDITLRSSTMALPPGNANYALPGTGIETGPLNVRGLVDENLEAWFYIANWMSALSSDVQGKVSRRKELENSSMSMDILDNNKKPLITFTYERIFPQVLAEVEWDHQDSDVVPQQFSVMFGYTRFSASNTRTGAILYPLGAINE